MDSAYLPLPFYLRALDMLRAQACCSSKILHIAIAKSVIIPLLCMLRAEVTRHTVARHRSTDDTKAALQAVVEAST
jgi:hypothetical protein